MVFTNLLRTCVSMTPSVVSKTFSPAIDLPSIESLDHGVVIIVDSGGDEEVILVGPVDAVVHPVIMVVRVETVVMVPKSRELN